MDEAWRWTASETARRVRAREVTARAVAESALARLDAANPSVNAVVAPLHDEALAAADAIDATLAAGGDPGPMAGATVTIKVNTDQAGQATTNGLRLNRDHRAAEDSPVVANLRRAGAVIVGRTNTPAFSLRWFCRNGLHGATRNPRDPALTPGGSSGGAAAAVASGICAVGHATDIAGSIRYPAYACGVHGLRPGLGRVPAVNLSAPDRHIGAQLMAVSGPIARSVSDVGLAFAAMAAEDPRDPWHAPVPLALPEPPRRAALCLAPEGLDVAPEVIAALQDAAAKLRDAGWRVEEADPPPLRAAIRPHLTLWLAELRRTHAAAVAEEGDPDARFVFENLSRHAPEPDVAGLLDALQTRARLIRDWRMFFEAQPLLLLPVSARPPFPDHADVASPESFDAVLEAQLPQVAPPFMGLPGLTVATSETDAAPMGVQLLAGPWREDLLLEAGAAIAARGAPIAPVDPR